MRMNVVKTGPYGFGLVFHVVHMTDDVQALNEWYRDVFDAWMWWAYPELNYLEVEERIASMLIVGDLCIETMAPSDPLNLDAPVARFYHRYGRHLHSVGYFVDDVDGFANRLHDEGISIAGPGGGDLERAKELGYFYPRPREAGGVMLQVTRPPGKRVHEGNSALDDPRLRDDWTSQTTRWDDHPLGVERLAYVTVGVRDIATTKEIFERLWQAVPVHDAEDWEGARSSFVQLGHVLLRFARPPDEAHALSAHIARYGDMLYGLTFLVRYVDAADAHLRAKGIRTHRAAPGIVATDPDDCHGVPFSFTSTAVPGDPLSVAG